MRPTIGTAAWTSPNSGILSFGSSKSGRWTALLADRLLAAGFSRQLSIVDSDERARLIAARYPQQQPLLTVSRRRDRVRQNNADVLILHELECSACGRVTAISATRAMWPFRLPHCRAWSLPFACGLVQFFLGRLGWPALRTVGRGRSSALLWVFNVRRPRPYLGVRRFIPQSMGVPGFIAKLQTAGLRPVALRWFESLPELAAGEDLDSCSRMIRNWARSVRYSIMGQARRPLICTPSTVQPGPTSVRSRTIHPTWPHNY